MCNACCAQGVVRWCCERNYVDINTRNNADYTALHETCAAGHCHVASCLIQFGADVHALSQLDGARSDTTHCIASQKLSVPFLHSDN